MEVGQKIFLKPIGNAARGDSEIKECVITKIGRKYFEVDPKYYGRFNIESMSQDSGRYISNYQAYLSITEIEEEREAQAIYGSLRNIFSAYTNRIPLDKLRGIKEILDN
jgi:hypothetical protein